MGNSVGLCSVCNKQVKLSICSICNCQTCKICLDYPIISPNNEPISKVDDIQYVGACKNCFIKHTKLDFSKNFEIIGDKNKKQIVFVHGGGSCRRMFEYHAKILEKEGFRSIMIDLPGHGSLMDTSLTMDSCIEHLKQSVKKHCLSQAPLLIGGSFGGYLIMETLGKYPSLCKKAIVMMSGQNVGQGRSWKAGLGLWAMNKTIGMMSQELSAKNKHMIKQPVLDMLQSGFYFKSGSSQINFLKSTRSEQSLQKTDGKIAFLFINGSQDYRDSDQIFLKAAGNRSKLLTYEQGDHFFSHDERFAERLIKDIIDLYEKPINEECQ